MSIIRVGLAETKNFAEGYDAIFGKKTTPKKTTKKKPAARGKKPARAKKKAGKKK